MLAHGFQKDYSRLLTVLTPVPKQRANIKPSLTTQPQHDPNREITFHFTTPSSLNSYHADADEDSGDDDDDDDDDDNYFLHLDDGDDAAADDDDDDFQIEIGAPRLISAKSSRNDNREESLEVQSLAQQLESRLMLVDNHHTSLDDLLKRSPSILQLAPASNADNHQAAHLINNDGNHRNDANPQVAKIN